MTGKVDSLWIQHVHSYYSKYHDIVDTLIKKSSSWVMKSILKVRDAVKDLQEWDNMMNREKFHTRDIYFALINDDKFVP